MALAVRLGQSATGPEPARLEKNLGPGVEQKPFIPGRLPVLPDRVGDVRANVLLLLAAKDMDDLTIRTDNLLRSRLCAGIGGLPGVECTAPGHPVRLCPRAFESAEAIHEQRPGRFGPGQDIEGEQVDFRVPEHMSMIVVASQRPGTD